MGFLDVDPIKALVLSAIVNGVISVPIMVVMMMIGQSKRLMGRFTITRAPPRPRLGRDRRDGRRGRVPVRDELLAFARGGRADDSVPGIGERRIADIRPHERTTPAGRFAAELGTNTGGEDILWVDYDAAVSMHRVRPVKAPEKRLERLASASAADNRISYGCINIPAAFYDGVVKPLFQPRNGIVYVLPDTKPLAEVFGAAVTRTAHR